MNTRGKAGASRDLTSPALTRVPEVHPQFSSISPLQHIILPTLTNLDTSSWKHTSTLSDTNTNKRKRDA